MRKTSGWAVLVSAVGVGFGLFACAAPAEDDTGSGVEEVNSANTLWELAQLCQGNIDRHSGVKQEELAKGVVRWQCGDRPDLDLNDPEQQPGQEYCEYHAVNNGKKVKKLADVDRSKPLSCFYTSVYADVDGQTRPGAIDQKLATALSAPENLGSTVAPDLIRMKGPFNKRGAATTLIVDSTNIAKGKGSADEKRHQRTAACFLASQNGGDKAKLKAACDVKNLEDDAQWKKAEDLGVKIAKSGDASYDAQQDIYACMAVKRLEKGGVDWRMSDPHIAQIAVRATNECGCSYSALPPSPKLDGFPMGHWSGAENLPPGCRRAKVDGKDYQQLTICDVSEQALGDLELNLDYSENLQKYCNDTFGVHIVLTAPLRHPDVEAKGSCKSEGAFCSAFSKTALK